VQCDENCNDISSDKQNFCFQWMQIKAKDVCKAEGKRTTFIQ
jgi:hypothetical protein